MNNVYDFFMAALPWVTMGLTLAIVFARVGRKDKNKTDDYGSEGMCLGLCFGAALSSSLKVGTGLGLALGLLLGLLLGSRFKKESKNDGEE